MNDDIFDRKFIDHLKLFHQHILFIVNINIDVVVVVVVKQR